MENDYENKFDIVLRCITDIEDYFEYSYLNDNKVEIKQTVMEHIDKMTEKLKMYTNNLT